MSRWLWIGLVLVTGARAGVPTNWVSRGLGAGGGLYNATISPHNSNEIFVTCDMSELYRTTDNAASWTTIDFRQLTVSRNNALQFTSDPNTLYVYEVRYPTESPVQSRPAKSVDGGATWGAPAHAVWPTNRQATAVCASWLGSNLVLVTTTTNLYASLDGGATYSNKFGFTVPNVRVAGTFFEGSNVFVATSAGLLWSTNGAASFALTNTTGFAATEGYGSFAGARDGSGLIRFYCVTAATNVLNYNLFTGSLYNAYRGVYRLDWTPGQPFAWQVATTGIPASLKPGLVALTRTNIHQVYLTATRSGSLFPDNWTVLKSTNAAMPWAQTFFIATNQNLRTGWGGLTTNSPATECAISYAQPLSLGVDPNDPAHVVVSDNALAYQTLDGGGVWRQIHCASADENVAGQFSQAGQPYHGVGLEPTVCYWLDWPAATNVWAAFADLALTHSWDGGQSWAFDYRHATLPSGDVYHTLHHATNGTQFAINSFLISPYQFSAVDDANVDGALTHGANGVYQLNSMTGRWQLFTNFNAAPVWLSTDPARPDRLYVSAGHSVSGGIWRTDNSLAGTNASWSKLAAITRTVASVIYTSTHPYNVRVLTTNRLVVSCSARQQANTGGPFLPVAGVFESLDNGASWSDRAAFTNALWYYVQDVVIDPLTNDTWWAGVWNTASTNPVENHGGLWRTRDAGTTWTRVFTNGSVTSCTFNPLNPDELYVSTHLLGLWISTNAQSVTPNFTQLVEYPFREPERVFFNPYNPLEIWVTSNGNGLRVGTQTLTQLQAWRYANFGMILDTGNAADAADPDGDGLTNLGEYALGRDPLTADNNGLLPPAVTGNAITTTYTRRRNVPGLTYHVEVSDDLAAWHEGAGWTEEVSITPDGNGVTESVTVRALPPIAGADRQFLRLRLTQP